MAGQAPCHEDEIATRPMFGVCARQAASKLRLCVDTCLRPKIATSAAACEAEGVKYIEIHVSTCHTRQETPTSVSIVMPVTSTYVFVGPNGVVELFCEYFTNWFQMKNLCLLSYLTRLHTPHFSPDLLDRPQRDWLRISPRPLTS